MRPVHRLPHHRAGEIMLVCFLLLSGADAVAATRTDARTTIGRDCAKQVAAIRAAYLKKDYRQHAALSAGMVRKMRRIPVSQLESCEAALAGAVRKDGSPPYVTPLIDHGYRLARLSSKENTRRFRQIARVVHSRLAKEKPAAFAGVAQLRGKSRKGLRPHSANVGYVVLAMTYSKLGQAQFAKDGSPEQLPRLLELYRNCADPTSRSNGAVRTASVLTVDQRARCDALAGEFRDSFPGGTDGPAPADLTGALQGGIMRGPVSCLAAEDPATQMLTQFEEYSECRRDEQRRQQDLSRFSPGGVMNGGESSVNLQRDGPPNVSDAIEGLALTDESHTSGEREDGTAWRQDDYTYGGTDGNGQQVEVTIRRSAIHNADGSESTQTQISIENSEGRTEYNYQGQNGGSERMTSQLHEGSDGSAYMAEFHSDGSRTEVAVDAEGNSVTIQTDANGNETVVERDKEGNPVSESPAGAGTQPASSASTPVGDEGSPSNCQFAPRPDKTQQRGRSGGLGPWIMPNPDAAPETAIDSCLTSFLQNQPARCPPSVALCVEPPPAGSCSCGTRQAPGGVLPGRTGTCAVIDCGPEGSCNPATGTCGNSNSGASFPGLHEPLPIPDLPGGTIRPGGPSVLRSNWSAGRTLWQPPSSRPGFTRLFGGSR